MSKHVKCDMDGLEARECYTDILGHDFCSKECLIKAIKGGKEGLICIECRGTGSLKDSSVFGECSVSCSRCHGTGKVKLGDKLSI